MKNKIAILGMATAKGFFNTPKAAKVSKYAAGSAVFTAEPTNHVKGLYTQTVIFRGCSAYVEGDKIPSGIFFDMHKAD